MIQDESSAETVLDLDALGDSELDAQLDSLRNKLSLVSKIMCTSKIFFCIFVLSFLLILYFFSFSS